MGQPKLLLPLAGKTVIEWLVGTLQEASIDPISVLCRADDSALQAELRRLGVTPIIPPCEPADMRESVTLLLRHIAATQQPQETDGWMLIPADHPFIPRQVLNEIVAAWKQSPDQIVVPRHGERRGHPTIFPWSMSANALSLPEGEGLNRLLRGNEERVHEVMCDSAAVLFDLDTPNDYARAEALVADRSEASRREPTDRDRC